MAKFTILLLLILLPMFMFSAAAIGARVGMRTPVKNVEDNKEVQDLGKYCVEEYNKKQNGKLLVFTRVVRAETQVVSGIKYYLDISASSKSFEAVVVVKPWLHSKQLLNFAPHSPPKNTK